MDADNDVMSSSAVYRSSIRQLKISTSKWKISFSTKSSVTLVCVCFCFIKWWFTIKSRVNWSYQHQNFNEVRQICWVAGLRSLRARMQKHHWSWGHTELHSLATSFSLSRMLRNQSSCFSNLYFNPNQWPRKTLKSHFIHWIASVCFEI